MMNFNLSNIDKNNLGLISPLVLAYIGDAVFEVYIRTKVVNDGFIKTSKLHTLATGFVKAKAQADALDRIYELLSDEEKDIIRRGRNAQSKTIPKNAEIADYKKATALEALIGYLFLSENHSRLDEIIEMILGG